jgi:hypothetical protein
MNRKSLIALLVILSALSLGGAIATAESPQHQAQAPLGTTFIYQGRLTEDYDPANGVYDFQFRLYNAASRGNQISNTVTKEDVPVFDGLFTVELDFGGDAFNGNARYLEISLRPGDETGVYNLFSPRQLLTSTPQALYSARAPWTGLTSVPAGLNDGDDDTLANLSCNKNQIAQWNGSNWKCSTVSSGGFNWGTSATGTGVGLSLTSTDGTPFYAEGKSDSSPPDGDPDIIVGGKRGIISSDSSVSGSIWVVGDNGDVFIASVGADYRDVHLQSVDQIYIDATDDINIDSQEDVDIDSGKKVLIDSVDDTEITSQRNIEFTPDNDVFIILDENKSDADFWVANDRNATPKLFQVTKDGNVNIFGNLTKGGGSFKIDHPLDPENQYLYHSFVESPDMMNIYNGNIILDENGEAWVELPEWFEALNKDFRYQLTPVGAPGPNLYIAEKIKDNHFKISGGEPSAEVSWQVTGIRHDPFAETNRIPVEETKPPEEQGTYLHPEAYGASPTSEPIGPDGVSQ